MDNKRVLLFTSGYRHKKTHGMNVGDVAQFENALLLLREKIPNVEITAVAHSLNNECVANDIKLNENLSQYIWGNGDQSLLDRAAILARSAALLLGARRLVRKKEPCCLSVRGRQALEDINNASLLFYAGAGTLNSRYLMGPAYIWILAMILARVLHTPVVLLGQQVGPINSLFSKWLFGIALRGVSFLGVRDHASYLTAKNLGVNTKKLLYTGDEGYYLPPGDNDAAERYLDMTGIRSDFIAVQFRLDSNSPFREHIAAFAKLYSLLSKLMDKPLVFIPFSYADSGDDRETAREIAAELTAPFHLLDLGGNARLTKSVLNRAALAVGVANHFCAFAASMGVPTVGIHATPYMAQKLDGLKTGRPSVLSIPVSELSEPDKLAKLVMAHVLMFSDTERKHDFNQRPDGYGNWHLAIKDVL